MMIRMKIVAVSTCSPHWLRHIMATQKIGPNSSMEIVHLSLQEPEQEQVRHPTDKLCLVRSRNWAGRWCPPPWSGG